MMNSAHQMINTNLTGIYLAQCRGVVEGILEYLHRMRNEVDSNKLMEILFTKQTEKTILVSAIHVHGNTQLSTTLKLKGIAEEKNERNDRVHVCVTPADPETGRALTATVSTLATFLVNEALIMVIESGL